MLDSIKSELHLRLNELFAEAAVDKLAGDADGYKAKLLTRCAVKPPPLGVGI